MSICKTVVSVLALTMAGLAVALAAPMVNARAAGSGPETAGETIRLPEPVIRGGMPLMQALSLRKSTRTFNTEELSLQQVSDLLWSAFGINRPDGKRTVPTAMNRQNMILFVALPSGVWRYAPESNELVKESSQDLSRSLGGAPCTIGYATEGRFGGVHAGSAYQNVGLYCASAGLANVVKATGADVMKKHMKLPAGYDLMIIQSIGKP